MKEKRICQLLLVPFIVYELARDGKDKRSERCKKYITLLSDKLLSKDSAGKIARRIGRAQYLLLNSLTENGKYSGHKVLLTLYFLTQSIFDEKEITEEEYKIMKRVQFVLQYCLIWESKERYKRLNSDDDFERLLKSAEKQATKIFNTIYKEI